MDGNTCARRAQMETQCTRRNPRPPSAVRRQALVECPSSRGAHPWPYPHRGLIGVSSGSHRAGSTQVRAAASASCPQGRVISIHMPRHVFRPVHRASPRALRLITSCRRTCEVRDSRRRARAEDSTSASSASALLLRVLSRSARALFRANASASLTHLLTPHATSSSGASALLSASSPLHLRHHVVSAPRLRLRLRCRGAVGE
ncbi:hypothetical protein C8J57DRAFT_316546 [Mycena rebaudengoi]|nr:hypothetical protein C8J57DRAFT_316546 [Mycena rebaudengoi]